MSINHQPADSPAEAATDVSGWRDGAESCYRAHLVDHLDDPFAAGFDSPELHEAQRRAHWVRTFGFPLPERRPDDEAPPLNQEWIDGLLDGGLPEPTANIAFGYVLTYLSWTQAYERAAYTRYLASLDRPDASDKLPPERAA